MTVRAFSGTKPRLLTGYQDREHDPGDHGLSEHGRGGNQLTHVDQYFLIRSPDQKNKEALPSFTEAWKNVQTASPVRTNSG